MKKFLYAFIISVFTCLPLLSLAQLTANFSANVVSGCSPVVVQFTNLSTGNPTSYYWTLGNGVTSTQQNPSTTYTLPGTYTVTLTVYNGSNSNTYSINNYITVLASPSVNFVVSDSGFSCPPKTVQFTNLSVPGGSGTPTYYWDFGNGTNSSLQNPSATYTTSGNFNVSLIVTNSNGCSSTFVKNNYVHTYAKPTANFTSTNANSCTLPATVQFTNTSSGAISYQWDFGNGNTSTATSPSHTYTTSGSYTVKLIATNANGCKDTMIKPAHVNIGNLSAQFTWPTTACVNNPVTFTNTSSPGPGNSTWYFGDGGTANTANGVHAYTTPGTYTVKLVVNYTNCSDSITHNITITPGPDANFTGTPLTGCAPLNVQFTNTSTGAASYYWIFGNGNTSTQTNPSTTYTAPNMAYTVKLVAISSSGCTDTQTNAQYVTTVMPLVNIAASPVSGCAPFATSLSANPLNVTIATYNWSFGDNTPNSTSANPSHTYTVTGNYVVTLNYTTTNGCTGSSQYLITVGNPPNANFTASPTTVCPNQQVTFTNLSTGPVGTGYLWLFGDGTTSTQQNPTHVYNGTGPMSVTLIANSNGCTDTFIINNYINVLLPDANFTFNVNCTNKFLVNFTNTSIGNSTNSWNFGDGGTSTSVSPSHTYVSPGMYNVRLIVTNTTTGCIDSITQQVRVFQDSAKFTISDTTICEFESVILIPQVNSFALYNSFKWAFGDNTASVVYGLPQPTLPHTYVSAGNYMASLIVTDIYNCKDTLYKAVHVGGPVINFTGSPTSGCAPLTVQFQDLSYTPGSTITTRNWIWGDNTTLTTSSANASHVYVNAGAYTVRLFVTDAVGCTDSITQVNYINTFKPQAGFYSGDTVICPGQTVTFTNTSTGNNLTYAWTFGDGGTSTQQSPTHVYTTNGNFTVRLIVTDGSGCKDTLIRTNYIHSSSIGISFNMSGNFATCPPYAVNFTNTSTGNITSYMWDFGNGSTSTINNPSALYTYPGTYTVTLTGQSTSGCMLTATNTITVLGPTATISYTPTSGCAPLNVQFTAVMQGVSNITWDFNDGVTQTTTSGNVSHLYTQPGLYVPLVILSNGSCAVTLPGTDTIKAGNLSGNFTFTPSSLCQSGNVQFTDTVWGQTTGITRNWLFGDGGTSTAHNPTHFYNAPGTYQVRLVVGNNTGCYDTIIHNVVVNPLPNVSAGPDQAICFGQNTSVQLQATGAVSYTWSPATGLSCTNCANPVASPTTTTSYVVTGTASNGCTKKDTVIVNVNTPPVVNAGNNQTICQGATAQLQASGGSTYVWSGNNLSCTNCSNPVASPTATTTYTVIGTNTAGCSDTDQVTITVLPAPTVTVTPNQTICPGSSVPLQAGGAQTYSWTPTTGLSCTNCANPTATPPATTTYVVTGISTNGCPDTAHVTVTISLPPVNAGPDAAVCDGNSVQLQATGAVSYVWSPGTGLSCTSCSNPIANPTSTTTYTVTGTDTLGCTNTDQIVITLGSIPVVSAGNDQVICEGDGAQLLATGADTYVWSPNTNLSCTNCNNPTATPATSITYTVIGTTLIGCSDTDDVFITVNPAPGVNAGDDKVMCNGEPAQLLATGAVSYVWSPADGLSCTTCDNPIATPTATTTYTVTGTGTNGCTATDDVVVNIYALPAVNAGADVTICNGQSAQLQASGADTYTWTPGDNLSCIDCPNPVANPGSTATYTVEGTDANGCKNQDEIEVTVLLRQPVSVSGNDSICVGESTQISATGGDGYLWLPPDGLDNNQSAAPVASPTATTDYMAIIQQQGCFADTAYLTVVVSHPPVVSLGPDQKIVAGSSIQLLAEGTDIYSYAWNNDPGLSCLDCKDPLATPEQPTVYTVTVSNEYGCDASDDISISLMCDNSQVFIPNTFTPNGDGNNDMFYPSGKGVKIITLFRVYSRWGELMFEARNIPINKPEAGWDGTFKGKTVKPDVFVYLIEAQCNAGDLLKYKGDISLIR